MAKGIENHVSVTVILNEVKNPVATQQKSGFFGLQPQNDEV
ncbi:MAG: hypothetical protein SFU55_04455 [Methylophilus sp.]|nr:hypothetical protein [Methylophilus sp.]